LEYVQAKYYDSEEGILSVEEGMFTTDDPSWVVGDIKNLCPVDSPDGKWICTRTAGHKGAHVAGTGPLTYAAYWSNTSRRESSSEEFFADLGL
jgi:hypothetical protein